MSMSARLQTSYLMRISRQQESEPNLILHFDPASRDLRTWFWPVSDAGLRVNPTDLSEYRITHRFQNPCCLCGCQAPNAPYTESAIYIAKDGPYTGEYLAGCAFDNCRYLVLIERMYNRRGLLLRQYPARSGPAPPPISYLPRGDTHGYFVAKPARRAVDARRMLSSIPMYKPPIKAPETALDKLLRLDSWGRGGLSEAEFRGLFAKCICGLVMTRRVFKDHICAVVQNPSVVIDLTSEPDDSDNSVQTVIDLTSVDSD